MRSTRGIQLVEMVVAVGLSGIFVVMLSGLLAQTLGLSSLSQNQILASAVADQVTEMILHQSSQATLSQLSDVSPNPVLQLDVDKYAFGVVSNGNLDLSQRWTDNNGNQFKGTVSVGSVPSSLNGLSATVYTVKVTYPSSTTGGTGTLTRTVTVFDDGAKF